MSVRLVVGLGNPGKKDTGTRHNIGFMILDRLAKRAGLSFQKEKKWQAEVLKSEATILLKPHTYMNLSGRAVGSVSSFYKVAAAEILVVYDDADLPFGKLRLRCKGSAGGHNGIQSIIDVMGTQEIPRLRFGIGATGGGMISHVLGTFAKSEQADLDRWIDRGADAVESAVANGMARAMEEYNRNED